MTGGTDHQRWECDVCRQAVFDDYDECVAHEVQCVAARPVGRKRSGGSAGGNARRRSSKHGSKCKSVPANGGSAPPADGASARGPATSPDDPRVAEAVRLWQKAPALSVIQAMRAVCFVEEDCQARFKQMWIRRRTPNTKEMRAEAPPVPRPPRERKKRKVLVPSEGRTKKAPAPSVEGPKKAPAPSARKKRVSAKDAQEHRVHQKSLANYKAMVHKLATELYASEKAKEGGMSARQVHEQLSRDYDHVPSDRTIHRYYKMGLVGAAPMRIGTRGEFPPDVFENLCAAFQSRIRINQLNGEESENSKKKLLAAVNASVNKEGSATMCLVNRLIAATAEGILADEGVSTGVRGGRPCAVFYDPDLPRAGKERRWGKGGEPPRDLGAVAASLEKANDAATEFLIQRGYRGEVLRAKVTSGVAGAGAGANGGCDPGEGTWEAYNYDGRAPSYDENVEEN